MHFPGFIPKDAPEVFGDAPVPWQDNRTSRNFRLLQS